MVTTMSRPMAADVIQALYRAMLGYPADDDSVAWWLGKEVDDLVDAIRITDQFRERSAALADGKRSHHELPAQGAWRLEVGRGLTEITPTPTGLTQAESLRLFPWDALQSLDDAADRSSGADPTSLRVLGRYAEELVRQVTRRIPSAQAWAGLDGGPSSVDILVLCGHGDIDAVMWGAPQLVHRTRRRLIVPFQVNRRRPPAETDCISDALYRNLHEIGFVRVREMVEHRFGGSTVQLSESLSGAVPDTRHSTGEPGPALSTAWYVADRCSTSARP